MAVVSGQSISPAGITPTYNAASAGGDKIQSPEGCIVIIKNASGASVTATFVTPNSLPNGDAYPDKALAVPAGAERWISLGPEYTDSNSQASITWSASASVTFAVLQKP